MGSGSALIGTLVVCRVHELDQQVGPHVARGPTPVLIHTLSMPTNGFFAPIVLKTSFSVKNENFKDR
ncbi:MAG: hypothetical protein QOJ51_6834 [Acidobacteriaceae bacterium]|nr:hypothetical protein [Acidobacteriaceae bacterium]